MPFFETIMNETAKKSDLFLQFHFFYLYLQSICASAIWSMHLQLVFEHRIINLKK